MRHNWNLRLAESQFWARPDQLAARWPSVHILRSKLLAPADRLLFVGRGVAKTERKLLSTRIDLLDAFDDERVEVEIVPDVSDVDADIVMVAAGATIFSAVFPRTISSAESTF